MSDTTCYDLVTFDVYSALFDFAGSLAPVVRGLPGDSVDAAAFVATWRGAQLALAGASNSLDGPRLPFRDATRKGLAHALACHGASTPPAAREALVTAWDAIDPWPEAGEALRAVNARGLPIALLSNGDHDMLAALARRLPLAPDHVFSSEESGTYKPHPALYRLPVERLGLEPRRILHVAGAPMDVLGAMRAGLACAWSNRTGVPALDLDSPPDFTLADLSGLASII